MDALGGEHLVLAQPCKQGIPSRYIALLAIENLRPPLKTVGGIDEANGNAQTTTTIVADNVASWR